MKGARTPADDAGEAPRADGAGEDESGTVECGMGQLRWRCRRGMKELDLLLTRYAAREYGNAAPEQRLAFRRLLGLADPLIHAYLLGRQLPPDHLAALIVRITANSQDDPENSR